MRHTFAVLVLALTMLVTASAAEGAILATVPVAWKLKTPRRSITPDTRSVRIRVPAYPCGEFDSIKVVRTHESVTITASDLVRFVEQTSPYVIPPPCQPGSATVQTVKLKGRLGRRIIIDGQGPRAKYADGVVPPLAYETISRAYADLHTAGYRVAFPGGFTVTAQANCVTVSA